MRKRPAKKNRSGVALAAVFLVGFAILLYPTVSDYWNSRTQSKVVMSYDAALRDMKEEDYTALFARADAYNRELREIEDPFRDYERAEGYDGILNITGHGVMGYITIEKLHVELPIYHGTESGVLDVAVGHLEGSSLPVGGESTHCVLTGHRGLPSARLFTEIDKMAEGDLFLIHVLDRTLTYQVDQISVVLPTELEQLMIVEGEDLCTLVTCTPYGINTHRLLVRGRRVANAVEKVAVRIESDVEMIDAWIEAMWIGAFMLVILLIIVMATRKRG